ncbi:hypothetical protein [Microbulbifer pacificus]|uniref:hypothetical protein n=1 Tax=Microbulbifer pacificus TaxID=407164 RepID=UPI000CF4480D|nr:hypothetical protein [Microbulbifer pacificus]
MRLKIAVHIFFILLGLVITLIAVTDIYDALSASSQHVFGTEVGGWIYNSTVNYLLFNGLLGLVGLAAFFTSMVSVLRVK